MGLGTINSQAILEVLKLYGLYSIESYETITHIENRMYTYLVELENKRREREAQKRKTTQSNRR